MKLDKEVFSRAEFMAYAEKNLVLVQLDFPNHKPQADDLKKANRELAKKYHVTGYPTLLVIEPNGKVLWQQEGYAPGGPAAVIDAVNRCRKAVGLAAPVTAPAPVAVAVEPPKSAVPILPPAPPPTNPAAEPRLQGILYSSAHPAVVLDGRTYEEGQTVRGMRIVKIERDRVTVESKGETKVLKMKENPEQITVIRRN
jgi:hypothetical protein